MCSKEIITIAIVKFKGLKDDFFEKSLNSALAQIVVKYKIDLYLDDVNYICDNELVSIKEVPKHILNNPPKIREYIVNNTDTEYLAFWDSDDVYSVDRLQKQIEYIKKENVCICFSDFIFFKEDELLYSFFDYIGYNYRHIDLIHENIYGLGVCLSVTKFLKKLTPFPEVKYLDWWIALKCKYLNVKIGVVNHPLGFYRVNPMSISSSFESVTKDAVKDEVLNKLELFKSLLNEDVVFSNMVEYYETINLESNLESIIIKFKKRRYKNVWGGIVKYK